MKTTILILGACAPIIAADPQFAGQLQSLQVQHEKDLAAAAAPINARYAAALEGLLKRATQAADLDTANKIQEQLKLLRAPAAERKLPDIKPLFVGSTWQIGSALITFKADGTGIKVHQGKNTPFLWQIEEDNAVLMTSADNFREYFFFQSRTAAEWARDKTSPRNNARRR